MTPSHANGLLALLPPDKILNNQHAFVIGGETLHGTTVEKLKAKFPMATIYNHYGPSEAVVGCVISEELSGTNNAPPGSIPIGRAMDNVQVYVLNAQKNLHLPGSVGELAVAGEGLADGYLNDPELTSKKFIDNPFAPEHGGKLYCTGDLVRYLPDGQLMFVGRLDEQVKVRGYRIELGDIEAALKSIDEIKDSAAVVHTTAGKRESIVAYIALVEEIAAEDDLALHQEKSRRIKDYRKHLSRTLPDHMVPSVYVFMDSLPITANGKVDKKKLPEPQETDLQSETFVAPRSASEKKLCVLWQDILQLDKIGIHDNFFALGGHSLLATRLISLIRESFAVELPLRSLFEFSTVAELSTVIDAQVLTKNTNVLNEEEVIL